MAQLSSYTFYDLYALSTLSSIIITYVSEEVETGIEASSIYTYSNV